MLASITGIQDHIVSTEDIKEFVGADSFAIISHLFSPNTCYKLFPLIQELRRDHISDTIINRIIEGVRTAVDPAAEIATLKAQLAEREQTITELKKAAQAAAQGAGVGDQGLSSFWQEYPVIAVIADLYLAGKSREEIVVELTNKQNILTNLQAGALTKDDLSRQSDGAIKKAISRMKSKIVPRDK